MESDFIKFFAGVVVGMFVILLLTQGTNESLRQKKAIECLKWATDLSECVRVLNGQEAGSYPDRV